MYGRISSGAVALQPSGQPCFIQVNWDAEMYESIFYIQGSHMAARNRLGTAAATNLGNGIDLRVVESVS